MSMKCEKTHISRGMERTIYAYFRVKRLMHTYVCFIMIEVEEEEERLVCYFLKSPAATKILIQNVQSEAEANAKAHKNTTATATTMNPTRNVHMSFSL